MLIQILSPKHGEITTKIDLDDLDIARKASSWGVLKRPNNYGFYVAGWLKAEYGRRKVLLHRLLFDEPKGLVIDHINHDTLDNRRSVNLRVCTAAENVQNRSGPIRSNVTRIRGVTWRPDRGVYQAQVGFNKRIIHVGTYTDIREAERAVEKVRRQLLAYSQ